MAILHVVMICCFSVSALPLGSPPSANHQTQTEAQDSLPSSTAALPAAPTLLTTKEHTNKSASTSLSDTTVVIIVSVSLALLVCAIIPLMFYRNWRSSAEAQHIPEANKGNRVGNSPVRLRTAESDVNPETNAQNASQYAATFQALDPQNHD